MEPTIIPSALKHGHPPDHILHALRFARLHISHDDGFSMVIGPDPAGNELEVGVVDTMAGPVIVHCMRARPKYLRS